MTFIIVNCPNCKAKFKVDEVHLGKKTRCKRCDTEFVISRLEKNQEPAATSKHVKSAQMEPEAAKVTVATVKQREWTATQKLVQF